MKTCSIHGCTRILRARGWCSTHWKRWRAHGIWQQMYDAWLREHGHMYIAPEAAPAPSDDVELCARLRSFGVAYPENVFGPVTDDEREQHGNLITRNSAAMGRHCAKFMSEAADRIEALCKQVAEQEFGLNAALSEIGELTNERKDWARRFKLNDVTCWEWMARAERAEAQAAANEKDAQRYRWLRDAQEATSPSHPEYPRAVTVIPGYSFLRGNDFDAAIDAAIAAKGAGGGEGD